MIFTEDASAISIMDLVRSTQKLQVYCPGLYHLYQVAWLE